MLKKFRFIIFVSFLSILTNRYRRAATLAAAMVVMLGGLILALPVYAAGPVVDTAADASDGSCADGSCSLRDAIATVNAGETITFAGDYSIYLNSELSINKTVSIDASGRNITVSGDSGNNGSRDVRVFNIQSSGVVTLTNLNIVSGTASFGSGIANNGTVAINNSTISDNRADNYSGGIFNSGTMTINNSTLSNNQANYDGGGIYNSNGTVTVNNSILSDNQSGAWGGAIKNEFFGTMTINNSTLSNNQANVGGGILNYAATVTINNSTLSNNQANYDGGGINNSTGIVTVNNSTLSNNQSNTSGGGISNGHNSSSSPILHLRNTIIANSTGGDCVNNATTGTIATNAYNLIEDGSCNELDGGSPTGFVTGDPKLGPLQDNGGPTLTHALLNSSPAINKGDPGFDPNAFSPPMNTDQRGFGYNRVVNGRIDIGAFEYGTGGAPGNNNIFLPLIIKGGG